MFLSILEQSASTHGKSLAHPKGALIPISADVTNKSSIEQLVAEISKRESHVDVSENKGTVSLAVNVSLP